MNKIKEEILVALDDVALVLIEDQWQVGERSVLWIVEKLSDLMGYMIETKTEIPQGLILISDNLTRAVQMKDSIRVADLLYFDLKYFLTDGQV